MIEGEKYHSRKEFENHLMKYGEFKETVGYPSFENYYEIIIEKYNVDNRTFDEILQEKFDGVVNENKIILGEEIIQIEIIQVGLFVKDYLDNIDKFYFSEWSVFIEDGKVTEDMKLDDEQDYIMERLKPRTNYSKRYISGFKNIDEALKMIDDVISKQFIINSFIK